MGAEVQGLGVGKLQWVSESPSQQNNECLKKQNADGDKNQP